MVNNIQVKHFPIRNRERRSAKISGKGETSEKHRKKVGISGITGLSAFISNWVLVTFDLKTNRDK
jgi:hypothetical protein